MESCLETLKLVKCFPRWTFSFMPNTATLTLSASPGSCQQERFFIRPLWRRAFLVCMYHNLRQISESPSDFRLLKVSTWFAVKDACIWLVGSHNLIPTKELGAANFWMQKFQTGWAGLVYFSPS